MKIKLNKPKKKYNCIVEEIDPKQISVLKAKIQEASNLEPWILTFVKRFHELANNKGYSKKDISDYCEKESVQKPQLKPKGDALPTSTLSAITNPESDNIRIPNINNLIMLAKCFNVSIDYLVGMTNCEHPQYEEFHQITGLSDSAITSLKLKKTFSDIPPYSLFPNSSLSLDNSGNLDVEALPNIDESGLSNKYYLGDKVIQQESIISKINDTMRDFPEVFDSQCIIDKSTDAPELIKQKVKNLNDHCPDEHFSDTLNTLITYKDGFLINLISKYLFLEVSDTNISSSVISPYNLFIASNRHTDAISQEAILLSEIQVELTRMHDRRKATT